MPSPRSIRLKGHSPSMHRSTSKTGRTTALIEPSSLPRGGTRRKERRRRLADTVDSVHHFASRRIAGNGVLIRPKVSVLARMWRRPSLPSSPTTRDDACPGGGPHRPSPGERLSSSSFYGLSLTSFTLGHSTAVLAPSSPGVRDGVVGGRIPSPKGDVGPVRGGRRC